MSAQSPSPLPERASDIVDLTEGMSDLDTDQESGIEENNNNEDTKDARKLHKKQKKKKNRANWRAAKAKKAKELEASKKSQEREVYADIANEGTSLFSVIKSCGLRLSSVFNFSCTLPAVERFGTH
jgi:FtsZ-interacting cell division protein YlmF